MSELKPCPCCNSSSIYVDRVNNKPAHVYCEDCGIEVYGDDCIELWNRRPSPETTDVQQILDAISIAGHLSKSMKDGESLVGWVKRLIEESHRPSPWLPIESAPKDKDILLLCPRLGVNIGQWDSYSGVKRKPHWTHYGRFLWGTKAVQEDHPTHWMPIPPTEGVTK